MQDLKTRLEKLATDAAECEMIASLASDRDTRETFRRLAAQHRETAEAVREVIAEPSADAAAVAAPDEADARNASRPPAFCP